MKVDIVFNNELSCDLPLVVGVFSNPEAAFTCVEDCKRKYKEIAEILDFQVVTYEVQE